MSALETFLDVFRNFLVAGFIFGSYIIGKKLAAYYKPKLWKVYFIIFIGCGIISFFGGDGVPSWVDMGAKEAYYIETYGDYPPPINYSEKIKNNMSIFLTLVIPATLGVYLQYRKYKLEKEMEEVKKRLKDRP